MAKNPPAFPIPNATDLDGYVYAPEASGMMLRDYFAGQALAGMVSHQGAAAVGGPSAEIIAAAAFAIADALLAMRERGQ